MTQNDERILGIDPGTRHVGYGVIERRGAALVILASGSIDAGSELLDRRLVHIYRRLREVIRIHQPVSAAIETVFAGNNPRTAIAIGEGRGVAVLAAAEQGLSVSGYEPAAVKRAVTGSGRAGKEQVRQMIRVLFKLDQAPETDHESDALALAATHALRLRYPQPVRGGATVPGGRKTLPDAVLAQLPPGVPVRNPGRRKRNRISS